LINAVSTYANGAELEQVSARDANRYDDSGVNWRVVEGYGKVIAAHGAGLPVMLGQTVRLIDRGGRRLRVETAAGAMTADIAIVTVSSALLAEEKLRFSPALPEKTEAAAGLPLGLADKLFLSLAQAEEFDKESRLFGRTGRSDTGVYHFRPFGRPQIEAYFGGRLAAELEAGGEPAFIDFAIGELTGLLGSAFARRVKPLHLHRWGVDPFARGSYSYAMPARRTVETCSRHPSMTACFSPARRVRAATIPRRTAPISPEWPRRTKQSPLASEDRRRDARSVNLHMMRRSAEPPHP
jgi:monoamine oxidase